MFVINDTLGVYGGSQTLILRVCTWLCTKKIATAIITDSIANTEIVDKLKKINVTIECVNRNDISSYINVLSNLCRDKNVKVVSFVYDFFIDIELAKRRGKLEFDNLIYCIHPEAFNRGTPNSTIKRFLKIPLIYFYRNLFIKMNNNNSVFMMDEINTIESEKYLNVSLNKKPAIIRLPMICRERPDFEKIINDGCESQMILTASRAEYPYKGYIFGLLEIFVELKKSYPELKLTIVSGGGDLDRLYKCLTSLKDNIKSSIIIYKWMDYESLLELAKNCKLFIGMGTSVLDMALCYKPAIAVKFNTYECLGDSFISEKPEYITTEVGCTRSAKPLIRKVLDMDKVEYRQEAIKSFESVKRVYDIDLCMSNFINSTTKKRATLLSLFDSFIYSLYKKYVYIKTKKTKRAYDYNDLQKEK